MEKQPGKIIVMSPSLNHDFEKFIMSTPDLTATLEWIKDHVPSEYLIDIIAKRIG